MAVRTANLGEVTIEYWEGDPQGEAILLLPGFPDTWRLWQPVLADLSDDYHVFAATGRGMGGSGHPGSYRIVDYRNDVISFLEQIVGGPAVVVGQSAGGWRL